MAIRVTSEVNIDMCSSTYCLSNVYPPTPGYPLDHGQYPYLCRRGERQVAAGCAHSLAVTGDGSVFTFGNGCAGQLGHWGTSCESRPKAIA